MILGILFYEYCKKKSYEIEINFFQHYLPGCKTKEVYYISYINFY